MKIKTTKNQLDGIVLLLGVLLEQNRPKDIAELFVFGFVDKAFNKLRVKSESLWGYKNGYSFNLTDQEAMAIYLFLQKVHIPEKLYRYEAIQINMISDEIHKAYGALAVA